MVFQRLKPVARADVTFEDLRNGEVMWLKLSGPDEAFFPSWTRAASATSSSGRGGSFKAGIAARRARLQRTHQKTNPPIKARIRIPIRINVARGSPRLTGGRGGSGLFCLGIVFGNRRLRFKRDGIRAGNRFSGSVHERERRHRNMSGLRRRDRDMQARLRRRLRHPRRRIPNQSPRAFPQES